MGYRWKYARGLMGVVTSSEDARTTDAGATAASDAAPSNAERRDVDDDVLGASRSLSFDGSDAVARGRMDRDLRSSRARETDRDAPMRTVGARPASDDMRIVARHTDRARATLCWIAWKVHCGVARCMPSFERSPADRGVGDLAHLPKVPTGRARQKYLRADEETNNRQIRGRGRATHDRADASSRRVHPQRHSPRRLYLTSRRGYTRSTTPYAPDRVPPPTPRGFFGSKQQDVHQE